MANDRIRPDEQDTGPGEGRPSDASDERVGNPGIGEDIRGTAHEREEDFEDMDDLEGEDEDSDSSY
jgi:hypothetical protein